MEGEGGGRLHILPSSLISVEGGGGEIVGPTETGGRIKEDDPTSFLGAATFRATFQIFCVVGTSPAWRTFLAIWTYLPD